MKCTIYANCQGQGLAHFLRKSGAFPYDIEVFQNHQLILKEVSPEALEASAVKCDLFIYQPTDEKHGQLSSDHYLKNVVPRAARKMSFAYFYNHGFFPLIESAGSYIGADFMPKVYWKMTLAELMQYYDMRLLDFGLTARLLHCASEQARREISCDVKLASWIVDHRHMPLFLNFNHPSSILFAKLAQEVIRLLSEDAQSPQIGIGHLNEAKLPCDLPLSEYVVKEFGMGGVKEHPEAHMTYRRFLEASWRKPPI